VPIVAAMLCALATAPAPATPATPVEGTSCTIFPADNVWHLDVSKLPVNRRSDAWKRAMHAKRTFLHPDFGPPSYGIPDDVVDTTHADVTVDFSYAGESDPGPYPFGPDIHVEGGSDRHAIMLDRDTCTLYELYAARWNGGDPKAGSGAVFDLASNALRPAGWTSADAAGLPIAAGLLRYDEVAAGDVDHAIRVTAACTHDTYIWPARHEAGTKDRRCPPMGARFRLKASFDNPDNALWPGLSVSTRLLITTIKDAVVVADSAVQRGPNGLFAYVVTAASKAELRDLKVSRIVDGRALVEQGLSPGERIITSGHYRVQPGGPIQVLDDQAKRTAGKPSADKLD
jgi:hypothetical protein